jgi:hypothetical protein
MPGSKRGPVESAVRDDIGELGDLVGLEPSLAATAYRLAQAIDADEDGRLLPSLTKELRSTLKALMDGRVEEDDDEFGDLASAE